MAPKYRLNPDMPTRVNGKSEKERLIEAIQAGDSKVAKRAFMMMNDTQLNRVRMLVEVLPEKMSSLQSATAASCLSGLVPKDMTNILNSQAFDSWRKQAFVELMRTSEGVLPQMAINSIFTSLQFHKKSYDRYGDSLTKNWLAHYISDMYGFKRPSLAFYLYMYSQRYYGEYESLVSTFVCSTLKRHQGTLEEAMEEHLRPSYLRGITKCNALMALKNKDTYLAKAYAKMIIERFEKCSCAIDLNTVYYARSILAN